MRGRRGLAALVIAIALTGCTHALTQPMPAQSGPLEVKISQETASGWTDMPIGVHRIPDTSVYVSGHQGAAGVGMLFGVIGLAAAHAAAQSTGEKKAGDPTALRVDIAADAARVVAEEIGRREGSGRFTTSAGGAAARLEIVPYVVLTFIGEERVRPWVVLKTALKTPGGDETWKTRYIAGLDDPRLLGGDDGWTSAGGENLRQALDRALRAAVDVMLRDAAGELPRGQGRAAKIRGHWVWVKPPMEITVEILDETPDRLVVKPEVPDGIVFAGINILAPRALTVTPAP